MRAMVIRRIAALDEVQNPMKRGGTPGAKILVMHAEQRRGELR
jgi:hypothetical protein